LAWLVLACWAFMTNAVFVYDLYSVHGTGGSTRPLFQETLSLGILFLTLLAPAITMNAFASERTQGTMQLLLTVPIREHQLVIGKFLAALAVLGSLVAITLIQPLILEFISDVHLPHLLAGFGGLFLACMLFASLGLWMSLLVDSPVTAYVLTFAIIMLLLLVDLGGQDSALHPLGQAIGLISRTRRFFAGEVRLGDVAYFFGAAFAFLMLAHASLRARRIHG
jgi:ABC-2 type transport system permease protein